MRQLRRTLAFGAACRLVLLVGGFDMEAHDAVGQTAASGMDQKAIHQVKRLLGGQDASDVAGWGHQVDDTYPDMAKLHFQIHDDTSQPFCGDVQKRIAGCEDNICLMSALKHFYGKVVTNEGRKTEYPAIDYDKVAPGIKFKDVDSVKMLINLIGDLHQPLQMGYMSDDTGRKTRVNLIDKEMSLYDVWDKGIEELVRTQEAGFWYGGWTHVRRVQADFDKDKELWKQDGAFKSFERWAEETVNFACSVAYKHPVTGKMLAGPGAETGPVTLDRKAYQMWKDKWLRQVLKAGARTAIVLNDILDAGGAAALAEGSAVKTKADEAKDKEMAEWEKQRVAARKAERAARSFSNFNLSALMTNMAIAAVVVPGFLWGVNYGMNPETYASLIKGAMAGNSNGSSNGSSASSSSAYPPRKREE